MLDKIKKEINHFPKRPFVKDVFILQIGNFFSLFLSMAASIVFARVLGAERYGVYSLIFAFPSLVTIFASIGSTYTVLTLLPEAYARGDKQEICNILAYFLKLNFFFTFVIFLAAIIIAPQLTDILYHQSNVGTFARWILLGMILQTFFIFFTATLQSIRKIKTMTILENVNKLFYNLLPIIFILIGGGLLWLVAGRFSSSFLMFFAGIIGYNYLAKKDELLPSFVEVLKNIYKVKISKYFKFGFLIEIDKNIGSLFATLPVIFLGILATNEQVGYFRIALSYIALPLLLATPISRILMVQLPKSKTYGLESLRKDFWKSSIVSGLIAAVAVLPFIFLAPFLVKLFYGTEFLPTISLIYHLIAYPIILGFSVGLAPILRTINRLSIAIIFNSGILLFGSPLIYFLTRSYGAVGASWGISFWYLIDLIAFIIYIEYYFRKNEKKILSDQANN